MKKEDIIIEIQNDITDNIINVCNNYGLDLEHLPFKKFKIKEVHKDVDTHFNEQRVNEYREFAKQKGLLDKFDKSMFNKLIDDMKKNLSEGVIFSVEVVDKTIYVEDNMGKTSITFENSVLEPNWRKEAPFTLDFTSSNKEFEKVVDDDSAAGALSRIVLTVMGVMTYLQIPNKSKEIQKTSKIDIESKKSKKKKSSRQNKTYIYKTTYRISDIDSSVNLGEYRGYKRKTEEWVARGHWRTLKNGKKIWIKESKRKSKIPVSKSSEDNLGKEYKITKLDL